MSHEKILAMLKGCDAQKPMTFDALQERSGLERSTLEMILDALYNGHAINRAVVMRDGKTQSMVWPTGVVSQVVNFNGAAFTGAAHPGTFVPMPRSPIQNAAHAPAGAPTSKKGAAMEKVTQQHVIDMVTAQPGIARAEVMTRLTHVDGDNKKQVMSAISNALHSQKITQSKESGKACLHPGNKKAKRSQATPPRTKRAPNKSPRSVGARRAAPAPAPKIINGAFRVAVYEDQGFTLVKDGQEMILDGDEVERLRRFISVVCN